jgi:ferritin
VVVDEQIKEESNDSEIVNKLELIEKEPGGSMLYMFDKDLSARIYTPQVPSKT